MKTNAILICMFLLCIVSMGAAQPRATASRAQAAASQNSAQEMSGDQVQGLRDDLNRMKAVVQQMETNLAFVDTSQTPLKHQFQLEIDMWRMMIRQMEKKLGKK